jgi:hypothetical protein
MSIPEAVRWIRLWGVVGLSGLLMASGVLGQTLRLGIVPLGTGNRITSEGLPASLHVLERSTDLRQWTELAILHDGPFRYPVSPAPESMAGYFRVRSRVRTAGDDSRNALVLPGDPFANLPANPFDPGTGVRWVKFLIRLAEPDRVWFQDSARHAFHVDFARLRIPQFAGMSPAAFDAVTLRSAGRQAILGTVLIPPNGVGNEYGIQFVSADPLPVDSLAAWFRTVSLVVDVPPGGRVFYVPTFEQSVPAQESAAELAARGIPVASVQRWVTGDQAYSDGWAFGRLRWVPGGEISAAYADGRLHPDDVLLTDAVPAEIPFVAGILVLTPATPNSHVALLARSYGVPFGYPASSAVREALRGWNGRDVALRVGSLGVEVSVIDPDGSLPESLRAELLALKRPAPLDFPPRSRMGVHITNVTLLTPDQVRFVGGKAAHYGLLRRMLPTNSPPAVVLTMDLWDDFLAQTLVNGRTLRAELALRLGGFTHPPDVARLRPALEGVRTLIRREARFSAPLQDAVVRGLQSSGLPLDRKLRFRSSTNLEDTDQFSGAGLYDSYSGCLTDDLDGNGSGPSACDPSEPEERGVFRAIQRVYASFYNENAFLARRRFGVDEDSVGMGVLVAESFPDEDELANGVATMEWSNVFGFVSGEIDLVLQPGAASVTNPDSAARPERVSGFLSGSNPFLEFEEGSGLLPLGARVLRWDSEYQEFARMFLRVASAYRTLSGRPSFTLDFEFKKSASRGLQVKQVREVPRPAPQPPRAPFLLARPVELVVEQGEFGDPMALHRLKSLWRVDARMMRVSAAELASTPHRDLSATLVVSGRPQSWTGGPSGWPGQGYSTNAEGFVDRFEPEPGVRLELGTFLPREVSSSAAPFLFPSDLDRTLMATRTVPRPEVYWDQWGSSSEDFVRLVRPKPITAASLQQERRWTNASGSLRVSTRFFWPERSGGADAGYTAPNIGFVETRIEGLIPDPLVLTGYWSQTYSPEHHNFSEHFLFEPRLDESVSATQTSALEAAGIRILHVWHSGPQGVFTVVAPDGSVRRLP